MLICNSAGRVEIISGTDARSADVVIGDTFEIEREDWYRYYGKLKTKNGFMYEPGLSGHRFDPVYIGKPTGIEYAILKSNIKDGEDGFWALWSQK